MDHAIKLSVLAEGVETLEQRDILEDMHCDKALGFLDAKPLAPTELRPFFERRG